MAIKEEIIDAYRIDPVEKLVLNTYDCIIISLANDGFKCDLKQMHPKKLINLHL